MIEIALVVLGFPFVVLVAVGLALFATDVLLITWTPFAIAISATMCLVAVLLDLLAFSWVEFGFSVI